MYVLSYSVFASLFKWSYAFKLLRPRDADKDQRLDSAEPMVNDERKELAVAEQSESPPKTRWEVIKQEAGKYLNMPVIAALAAIPLALIPGVNTYVFQGSGAVFRGNIVAGLHTSGRAAVPVILVVLGSQLSHGIPAHATITNLQVTLAVIGRLLIMP
jgi:predicted permease